MRTKTDRRHRHALISTVRARRRVLASMAVMFERVVWVFVALCVDMFMVLLLYGLKCLCFINVFKLGFVI